MEIIQKSIIIYLILSFLIFAAACLNLISSFSLFIILCIVGFSTLWLRRFHLNHVEWAPIVDPDKKTLGLLVLMIFFFLGHVFIIPPYARDDVIYHLLVPKQLFGNGGFRFDPFNIHSNFPMAFELPLTLFFLFKGWLSPFLTNYVMLFGLCIAFYLTARRVFQINHFLASAAVLLLATTPVVYDQVRSCYVEIFMSLLVLMAFYNYFLFRCHLSRPSYWYLTMMFSGFVCATKYTGGVFAAFILGVEFFSDRNRSQYYKGLLICIAVCIPWYLKNWILLDNPVFPLLDFLFSSDYISIERSIYYKHLFADYHWGKSLMDYLMLPLRMLTGYDAPARAGQLGFGGKLSFFFIFAFVSVAALFKKTEFSSLAGHRRVVGLLFVCYMGFWMMTSQQVRFLLPVLTVASLSGLSYLNSHWKQLKIPAVVVASLILIQNVTNIGLVMKEEKISALITKQITREQFLNFHMPISYKLAKKLNAMLDSQKHCLLAIGNFGRNFYFDVKVITNTYYEAEIFANTFHKERVRPKVFEDFVKQQGITHLLVNHTYLNQFFSKNPSFAMDELHRYLSRMPSIMTQESVVVYELKI